MEIYRLRHQVENLFARLKHFRATAISPTIEILPVFYKKFHTITGF